MTLSPVFRSKAATDLLKERGIWDRMRPAMEDQARAVKLLHEDLRAVLDDQFIDPSPYADVTADSLEFLQEYFFLILFRSLFESLGFDRKRLSFYCELNFCIKGTITAADNIFDDQAKSLLPLKTHAGTRFMAILQLMCFERLVRRACERAVESGAIERRQIDPLLHDLLSLMASIGELEGSEESGVEEIPSPELMLETVHRIRGGALFALSFIAPRILETGEAARKVSQAEDAVARLGTAFQVVDDLTDFEFDLTRRSHNLLTAQIHAHGSAEEKAMLDRLWSRQASPEGLVESLFADSARSVLQFAYAEARQSFETLAELGFWFPADLSHEVVHAIVGMDGIARMEAIAPPNDAQA